MSDEFIPRDRREHVVVDNDVTHETRQKVVRDAGVERYAQLARVVQLIWLAVAGLEVLPVCASFTPDRCSRNGCQLHIQPRRFFCTRSKPDRFA
jgi:hypothetical protein